MRERGGGEAEWMENLGEGERRGWGWMDGGVGGGREEGLGLDGCGNGMRKRRRGKAVWKGEWDKGKRRERSWMDGGVG